MRYEFDDIPLDIAGKPAGRFYGEYTLDGRHVDEIWLASETGWGPNAQVELIPLHTLADPFSRAIYGMLKTNIRSEDSDVAPRPVRHQFRRPIIGGELVTG